MTRARIVTARPPDPEAFAPFGSFITPPEEFGGRAHFEAWLEPVANRASHYHLNRVAPSALPVTVGRVERHPHAPQLFLPVGVDRYLVTVLPPGSSGAPDPSGAVSFEIPGSLGIVYRPGVWHAGISVLGAPGSFAVMMWRGGEDDDEFADIPPLIVAPPGTGPVGIDV